jgi:hypothetical protein
VSQDIYQNQTATFNLANLADAPVPGKSMGTSRADLIRELWGRDLDFLWRSYFSLGEDFCFDS